jgi:glutamate carboxypeptidase
MLSHADEATGWLVDKRRAMEDALAPLVECNSFTDNPEGGRKTGALLRDLFAVPGVDVIVRPSERFADHLVFRTRPQHPNRGAVALVGHLDTVFPPGTFEGFRRDGELLRGPGVLDMKGGLVIMAYALKALAATGGLDAVPPVRVVVVSDEEVGSVEGAGVIGAAVAGASVALVFEAGRVGDSIITRRKGVAFVTAVAHGRAAHAGNAHKDGANAVWAAAKFVDRVQALTDYGRGLTVNVGKFIGGETTNTVPDKAEVHVDARFCARADGDHVVASMHRIAAEASSAVEGTRIELHGGVLRPPLERTDASAHLLAEYGAAATAHGLGAGEAPLIGGGSDASTTSTLGIPTIDGLGPRGTGFHTKDEQIEAASLVPKAQALARFIAARRVASPDRES